MTTTTTLENTIEVAGHFGTKHVTRAQFTEQWIDHLKQLRTLSWEPEWNAKVDQMIIELTEQARASWQATFDYQNK